MEIRSIVNAINFTVTIELIYIPLINYIYELMYKPSCGQKFKFFFGFVTIFVKCYKIFLFDNLLIKKYHYIVAFMDRTFI